MSQTVISLDVGDAPAGAGASRRSGRHPARPMCVSQHLRRAHYVIALVSLLLGASATAIGLGTVAATTRQTLCLPGGGQCMYAADPSRRRCSWPHCWRPP